MNFRLDALKSICRVVMGKGGVMSRLPMAGFSVGKSGNVYDALPVTFIFTMSFYNSFTFAVMSTAIILS